MAKRLWLGMLIAALAFGMMLIGCDNSTGAGRGGNDIDPALVGTWICCCGEGSMVLNSNGTIRRYDGYFLSLSGTWTARNSLFTITVPGLGHATAFFTISGNILRLSWDSDDPDDRERFYLQP